MPSSVKCENGHYSRCRVAAREISNNRSLRPCEKCSTARRYLVRQAYPGKGNPELELVRVATLYSNAVAEKRGYDPMLFELKVIGSTRRVHWPFYWTKNRNRRWHVGQFPPIFWDVRQLPRLVSKLTQKQQNRIDAH